jgi:hypothetical protein
MVREKIIEVIIFVVCCHSRQYHWCIYICVCVCRDMYNLILNCSAGLSWCLWSVSNFIKCTRVIMFYIVSHSRVQNIQFSNSSNRLFRVEYCGRNSCSIDLNIWIVNYYWSYNSVSSIFLVVGRTTIIVVNIRILNLYFTRYLIKIGCCNKNLFNWFNFRVTSIFWGDHWQHYHYILLTNSYVWY